jgi:hypothetical protein
MMSEDYEFPELPYVCFGNFGGFVLRLLKSGDSDELVGRCFVLINEMAEAPDSRVCNLIQTTVLETLTDDKECLRLSLPRLCVAARARVDDFIEHGF